MSTISSPSRKGANLGELQRYAAICQVETILLPCLKALVA